MKVLVTDGGDGQSHAAVSAVRALAVAGHEVHVAAAEPLDTAGWSRHRRRRVKVPPAHGPEFADAVRRLVATERYDVVFPASDAALLRLSWPGAELVDKQRLNDLATRAGLATPAQWAFADGDALLANAGELPWPVAVKVATKSGHAVRPVFRADGPDDLAPVAGFPAPVVVEEWLAGERRSVAGVFWDGRLRAVVHQRTVRSWPRDCGVASFAVTTEPDLGLEQELTEMLSGYNGLFQGQLLGGRLHDVNPRVYGSISLAVRAGANLPDVLCRLSAGEQVGVHQPLRARPGVRYRWVEGDLRHLREAWRRGEVPARSALRALRPQRGTANPDLWASDPAPTLARLAYGVRNRRPGR